MNHYPKHIGDYLKKTIGLTMLQDGAYNRAVDLYYSEEHELPPKPEIYLALRCQGKADRDAVDHVLVKYFEKTPTGYRHDRCELELEAQRERTAKAAKGATAKWDKQQLSKAQAPPEQAPSIAQASAQTMPALSHKPVAISQEVQKDIVGLTPDAPPGTKNGTALRDAARRVLECLNRNAGRRYEPVEPNIAPIVARIREGYSERDLCAIAAVKARQWRGDEKMEPYIRPKTLFNATNAANYRAELPANKLEVPGA